MRSAPLIILIIPLLVITLSACVVDGSETEIVETHTGDTDAAPPLEYLNSPGRRTDTNPYSNGNVMPVDFNYLHLLKAFDVEFVDSSLPPFADYEVRGGGLLFARYALRACF